MKFFSGLVIGASLGTALAFVDSGKTSLGDVKKITNNMKKQLVETTDELISLRKSLFETLPQTLDDISQSIRAYDNAALPLIDSISEKLTK